MFYTNTCSPVKKDWRNKTPWGLRLHVGYLSIGLLFGWEAMEAWPGMYHMSARLRACDGHTFRDE